MIVICSIDVEKNRLGLSLLEKDTGVPENISKKFQKHLRNVDATVATDSTSSKKSVKRKAGGDSEDGADEQMNNKWTKVEQVDSDVKKVNEVSL